MEESLIRLSETMCHNQEVYEIEVKGLRLFANHGVFPEENILGQAFEIDLLLDVMHPAFGNDQLEQVLSYGDVIEIVQKDFTSSTVKLLETAAHNILDRLSQYPQIKHAKVTVKKLMPPLPVTLEFVGVCMKKSYGQVAVSSQPKRDCHLMDESGLRDV